MKVGDLVLCPVDLETGEILAEIKTLAIITTIYENEPKIGVTYVDAGSYNKCTGAWFIDEVELVSDS